MKKIYIYELVKDGNPYYIGRSSNPKRRSYSHKQLGRFDYSTCEMNVIMEVDKSEMTFWEEHYISLYRSWGFDLLNEISNPSDNFDKNLKYWLGKKRKFDRPFKHKGQSWSDKRRQAGKFNESNSKIIELHLEGYSRSDISKMLNRPFSSVCHIIRNKTK